MHRIAGEIALKSLAPDTEKAEKYFEHALSRLHEPRTPLALPGQGAASARMLAPVYGWFTEGFDTRDLKEAKALLEELAQ